MGFTSPCDQQSTSIRDHSRNQSTCPTLPQAEVSKTPTSCGKDYDPYISDYWKLIHELMLQKDPATYARLHKTMINKRIEDLLKRAEGLKKSCKDDKRIAVFDTAANLDAWRQIANKPSNIDISAVINTTKRVLSGLIGTAAGTAAAIGGLGTAVIENLPAFKLGPQF
ncbi:hypothetical protein [Noviherbaspirillum humi]|uniref:hypothetical protein n=1 Tax=Noviherbaspirillum humi TaxID=1688639 RepID=UPI001160591A|nr:hypothetical protein [Noviherbaspirillum humi]